MFSPTFTAGFYPPTFLGKDWESKVISYIDDGQSTQSYDQIFRTEALSLASLSLVMKIHLFLERWQESSPFGFSGDGLNWCRHLWKPESWFSGIWERWFCWSILWHTQGKPDLLAGPSKPPTPEAVDQKSDQKLPHFNPFSNWVMLSEPLITLMAFLKSGTNEERTSSSSHSYGSGQ